MNKKKRGLRLTQPSLCPQIAVATGSQNPVERLLLLGALMDGSTGVGLLLLPTWIMALLQIPLAPPLLHVRLIGAFVGTVGFLYALAYRNPPARVVLLQGLTWIRLAVAFTTGLGVLLGGPPGYLVVGFTDGCFAAVQIHWLRQHGHGLLLP